MAPTAPPSTPKTTTSTDPLYRLAKAQATAALSAEQAPVQAEQAASDAYYRQRATDASANAAALSQLLKGIGPAVGGAYESAAQNQTEAANGFSQGMKDALQGNTDNLNATLAKLGAPAQIDSHAGQAADVTYGAGGYYPAQAFRQTGTALEAAADQLPGTALLRGLDTVKQIEAQSASAHSALDQKLAEMAGNLPGDIQTNYAKLQSLALQNAKFKEQVSKDKFDQAYKTAQQKLAAAKYGTSVAEFNARQKLAAAKFAQQQFQQNREYGLQLSRLGISQRSLQLRIAQNAFKAANGGYSAKELNKIQVQAMGLAHSYFDGSSTVKTRASIVDKTGKGSTAKGPVATQESSIDTTKGISYGTGLTKMLQKGIPVQIALRALNSVYPKAQQFNPAQLDTFLGPLTPASIAAASAHLNALGASKLANAAGYGFNPYTVDTATFKRLSPKGQQTANAVLQLAQQYLGTPYVWGGESPKGFDCSGLAQYIYAKEGVSIPRTTYEQFQSGVSVPTKQLEAGDLVFFKGSDSKGGLPGHVGIYIGSGKFIEAPHTGAVVRVSTLAGRSDYVGARRYVS